MEETLNNTESSNSTKPVLQAVFITSYIPYGLKVCDTSQENYIFDLNEWLFRQNQNVQPFFKNHFDQILNDDSLKMVLRPISDIKKQILHNDKFFTPIDVIGEIDEDFSDLCDFDYVSDWSERGGNFIDYLDEFINRIWNNHHLSFLPFGFVQKLLEWNFDIFGLIDKGLAISIHDIE